MSHSDQCNTIYLYLLAFNTDKQYSYEYSYLKWITLAIWTQKHLHPLSLPVLLLFAVLPRNSYLPQSSHTLAFHEQVLWHFLWFHAAILQLALYALMNSFSTGDSVVFMNRFSGTSPWFQQLYILHTTLSWTVLATVWLHTPVWCTLWW